MNYSSSETATSLATIIIHPRLISIILWTFAYAVISCVCLYSVFFSFSSLRNIYRMCKCSMEYMYQMIIICHPNNFHLKMFRLVLVFVRISFSHNTHEILSVQANARQITVMKLLFRCLLKAAALNVIHLREREERKKKEKKTPKRNFFCKITANLFELFGNLSKHFAVSS